MWNILQYNITGRGTPSSEYGLFDQSIFQQDNDADQGGDTVETEIFHNPTTDVEMSNGQSLPPYSGQPVKGGFQSTREHGTREQLRTSLAPALPLIDSFVPDPTTTPWLMQIQDPVMDVTYDPFYNFQDPGSTFFGTWELGNL